MLVLSRKLGEKIVIGDNIVVTVVKIDRNQIRIGIEAPQRCRSTAKRSRRLVSRKPRSHGERVGRCRVKGIPSPGRQGRVASGQTDRNATLRVAYGAFGCQIRQRATPAPAARP